MSAISLRNVKKRYGKTDIIHGVDLEIEPGEFVVILGPSGCGKSTLLRMVAGLEDITGGEISIAGKVVNKLEPRERGCAMVFQNYALYPHMTVAGNIGYSLKVAGIPKAEREARVLKVAQSVGLETYLARRPGELSGGQRQRVAMARAMVREPKVFLFDEPFSNLDAKLRVAMRAEVRRLHRQLGVTSIFVTHDQVEAMTLADRLIIMNGGRVEQVGRPADIYDRPVSRFVADFIGSPAMNLLEGECDDNGHFIHGEGGKIAVSSLNGQRVPGRKIVLGIRPESVRRTSESGIGTIPGIVDYVEELGGARLSHATVAGSRLIALDDALHAFSIEDGKRIDIHAPTNAPSSGEIQ